MSADQNPIKKPLTIRLADRLAEGITTGHDWPNTNDELLRLQCAATLRTQYALLEMALAALKAIAASDPEISMLPDSVLEDALREDDEVLRTQARAFLTVRSAVADLTAHLDPKP